MKRTVIKLLLLLFIFTAGLNFSYSQENEGETKRDVNSLVTKYLVAANDALDEGEIQNAYNKVNNALALCKEPGKALNVITISRLVYNQKLEQLLNKYDEKEFIEVQLNLKKYPFIADTKTETLIEQLGKKGEKKEKSAVNYLFVSIIILTFIILLIVLAAIFIIYKGFKLSSRQQREYINAVKMLAANQTQTNRLMIGGITELYGGNPSLRIAGTSAWDATKALPDVEFSEEDTQELQQLAIKCEEIGSKIDEISQRKNNSKNVSEFVYKLSIQMGLPKGMAMLNFCASMIYDAGFLGMDPELLVSENLTKDQKEALKNHVMLADKYLEFVPKKYWSVFYDAATKHHENMDGSGYPKGLKGQKIPQIARLIRVAETYVSLSSKRNYRQAIDKETAISMMKEKSGIYDEEVVAALDFIL